MTAEIKNTNLLTIDGFIARFQDLLKDSETNEAAYEATEKEYKESFEKRRYSSYGGFRVTLTRWNYKRLQKKKKRDAENAKRRESRSLA